MVTKEDVVNYRCDKVMFRVCPLLLIAEMLISTVISVSTGDSLSVHTLWHTPWEILRTLILLAATVTVVLFFSRPCRPDENARDFIEEWDFGFHLPINMIPFTSGQAATVLPYVLPILTSRARATKKAYDEQAETRIRFQNAVGEQLATHGSEEKWPLDIREKLVAERRNLSEAMESANREALDAQRRFLGPWDYFKKAKVLGPEFSNPELFRKNSLESWK